jgi:uncharacterized protein YhaN
MHILRLHIDGFGILSEQDVGPLSPGLNCFLGRNEAGKSTCLRFFQSMLFGYRRGNRTLDPMADLRKKSVAGGTLVLRSPALGEVTLTRRPGARGGMLSLHGDGGRDMTEHELSRFFGGLTLDVFDSIFAFSLKSLMEFSSLSGDNVRHALHGAAFGAGLRSPARILKVLDERMAALLKRDPAAAAINVAVRELEDTREELRSRTPDMQAYEELQKTLENLETELVALTARRSSAEADLRRVRRRRDVRHLAEEIRRIRGELAELDCSRATAAAELPAPGPSGGKNADAPNPADDGTRFAPDAVQRLDALMAQQEERLLAVREAEEDCLRLEAEIADLIDPGDMAALYPAAQTLREQKERRKKESEELSALAHDCERLAAGQAEVLVRLGSGWNLPRIAAADLSIAAREEILRQEKILAEREQALHDRQRDVARLAEQRSEAERREEEVRARLNAMPRPAVPLPDKASAAEIAADLARADAALTALPRLLERKTRANGEYGQALADIDPSWTPGILESFDASPQSRLRLEDHGRALAEAGEKDTAARRLVEQAEEALTGPADSYAEAQERLSRYTDVPDSATIEERHSLLRRLHVLSFEAAVARREYEAANEALSACIELPQRKKRDGIPALLGNPLFLAGGLLLLAGFGVGGTGGYSGEPVMLYAGGLLALGGICACLLHRKAGPFRPEPVLPDDSVLRKNRAAAMERKNTLAEELAALARQAAPWLQAGRPEAPDQSDLARAARLLENYGRQLALRERDYQDVLTAKSCLDSAERRLERARAAADEARADLREAQALWQAQLGMLHLPPSLRPENAQAVFDRVAAARSRAAVFAEASDAFASAADCIASCIAKAAEMPFFADALADASPSLARLLGAASLEKNARVASDAQGAGEGLPSLSPSAFFALFFAPGADSALAGRALGALKKALAALDGHEASAQERLRLVSVLNERGEARAHSAQRLTQAEEALTLARGSLDAERRSWENWVREHGLSVAYSPKGAKEALTDMADFLGREKTRAACETRFAGLLRGLRLFMSETVSLARRAGMVPPASLSPFMDAADTLSPGSENGEALVPHADSMPLLVAATLHLLDDLCRKVETAARNAALRGQKQEQLDARSQARARAQTALSLTRSTLDALLLSANMPDAESFRAAFARARRIESLRDRERAALAALERPAAEEKLSLEALLASLEEDSALLLEEEEARLQQEIATLENTAASLAEARGQTRERREALIGGESGAPLRGRERELAEDIHSLSRRWAVFALARDILLDAKQRFEEEGQEGVVRYAGDLFAAITDGEYTGIAASMDGDAYAALHHTGDRRDPEKHLSQGTREQLYLALRLAYIKNHAAKAESVPVVMDDILVNFDPVRAANTAKVLAEFSRENQILFFTCHPAMSDLLLRAGESLPDPRPAFFRITRGMLEQLPFAAGPPDA